MLKLVILAQEAVSERAPEHPAPMLPHAPLTLQTHSVCQRACARMSRQALATVTDPAFAEITHSILGRSKPQENHPASS